MEYNSGSNRASNFKSAERVTQERFEITSTVGPELYDSRSKYQSILSIPKVEIKKSTSTAVYSRLRDILYQFNRVEKVKITHFNVAD